MDMIWIKKRNRIRALFIGIALWSIFWIKGSLFLEVKAADVPAAGPTQLIIRALDQSVEVGGKIDNSKNKVECSALIKDHELSSIKLVADSTDAVTEDGTITVSNAVIKNGDIDVTDQYVIIYQPGRLTVTPAEKQNSLQLEGWIYGDSPKEPQFTEVENGCTDCQPVYTYYQRGTIKTDIQNSGAAKTGEVPKDAGIWFVEAKLEANEYHGEKLLRAQFEIVKKQIALQPKDQTIKEGESILTSRDQVVGKVSEGDRIDQVKFKSSDTSQATNEGIIEIASVTIVDFYGREVTNNYKINKLKGRLIVEGQANAAQTAVSPASKVIPNQDEQIIIDYNRPRKEENISVPESMGQNRDTPIEPLYPIVAQEEKPQVNVTVLVGKEGKRTKDDLNSYLRTDHETLWRAVLNEAEIQKVQEGTAAQVQVDIERLTGTPPKEDSRQIEKMTAILSEYYPGVQIGTYVDISVQKKLGAKAWESVSVIQGMMELTMELPLEVQKENTTYMMMRYHNGKCELLEDRDQNLATITFCTDRFSTYAILYVPDTVVEEKNNSMIYVFAATIILAGIIAGFIKVKRKR